MSSRHCGVVAPSHIIHGVRLQCHFINAAMKTEGKYSYVYNIFTFAAKTCRRAGDKEKSLLRR